MFEQFRRRLKLWPHKPLCGVCAAMYGIGNRLALEPMKIGIGPRPCTLCRRLTRWEWDGGKMLSSKALRDIKRAIDSDNV